MEPLKQSSSFALTLSFKRASFSFTVLMQVDVTTRVATVRVLKNRVSSLRTRVSSFKTRNSSFNTRYSIQRNTKCTCRCRPL